jgi:hypothetical protein
MELNNASTKYSLNENRLANTARIASGVLQPSITNPSRRFVHGLKRDTMMSPGECFSGNESPTYYSRFVDAHIERDLIEAVEI